MCLVQAAPDSKPQWLTRYACICGEDYRPEQLSFFNARLVSKRWDDCTLTGVQNDSVQGIRSTQRIDASPVIIPRAHGCAHEEAPTAICAAGGLPGRALLFQEARL